MEVTGFKKYLRDKRLWAVALLLIGVGLWLVVQNNASQTKVSVIALSVTEEGIAPDTAFVIKVEGSPTPEELRAEIAVEPGFVYALTVTEEGTFLLQPLRILDAASTVTIKVRTKSFTFKVQNALQILSTFPTDGGEGVPVDSGMELTFNTKSLSKESFEAAFSISPPVEGSFEQGEGRFVFYPSGQLQYDTQYTVTLSPPLQSEEGGILQEPYQFSFRTMSEKQQQLEAMFQVSGNGISMNSLSSETPMFQAFIDSSIMSESQSIAVTLSAFPGWEPYAEALQNNRDQARYSFQSPTINTADYTLVGEFDVTPVRSQQSSEGYDDGRWVLQFPEALEEGWYAVGFTLEHGGDRITRQVFLQVSDLSVFYMLQDESMLVWVNDAATGQPVENASVALTGFYEASGVTGADGTAQIDDALPPALDLGGYSTGSTVLTIRSGERIYVDLDAFYYSGDYRRETNQYMSYLFCDRPIYHTTDTIQIWGMVRPRDPAAPAPQNLKLVLGNGVAEQEITPLPDGTFTASISFENMATDYWISLNLMAGETELLYSNVTVQDFVKPIYTAETAAKKPVYLLENDPEVGVTLDVSTFDGTPASSLSVSLQSWSGEMMLASPEVQSTDSTGHLDSALRITESRSTWYPQRYSYQFRTDDAQSENFYQQGDVYAIHRDVMLKGMPTPTATGMELAVTTNRIDISGIQTSADLWKKDALRGATLSQEVTAEVHKRYYTKIKTGTHYDFVSRKSVESFRYEENDDLVDTRTFSTQNGTYTLSDLPKSEGDNCYYVVLQTKDSLGRTVETTSYLGSYYSRYGSFDTGVHRYSLLKKIDPTGGEIQEDEQGVTYRGNDNQFEDNENVTFTLQDNEQPIEGMTGRVLYTVAQDTFSHKGLSEKAEFTLPYSEDLLPNYLITGAYFDGKHIFALENTFLTFDPRQRELEIALTPDKASYRPGEEVRVSATVTNKFTGQPAADASLVLSVVDEAIFAIQEQYTNILGSLYAGIYYPNIHKYTSYLQFEFGGAGEKGGGGGDSIRSDFQDTAYFATVRTDAQGKATFTYKLPDNITSWRLTSLALTPSTHAGSAKINLNATKEFFVMPVINQTLLEGDSFAVGLYGAGVAVADDDPVQYKVRIQGNDVDESQEVESTLRDYAVVDLGSLPKGDYTVTVEGVCGEYADGVQLPVTVVKSGVEVSLVKTFPLSDGISVDPLRYPVSISFYGAGAKTYNTVFRSVVDLSRGGRADNRLARVYTAQQFKKRGADWFDLEALEQSLAGINGTTLLPLTPYATPDLELSVQARLAVPELFSDRCLEGLTEGGDWYTDTRSTFYLAKALSGDPITENLDAMVNLDVPRDYVDRIYLTMAMAVSGDTEGARKWYDKLVTPYLAELTGIAGDKALYIKGADSALSEGACTAAASMLATMLDTAEADGLVRYLAEKKSKYEPYLFEQMYYLTMQKPVGETQASYSYQKNGKTITETLDTGTLSDTFTAAQLREASFKVLSGEVFADVYYAGAPSEVADTSKKLIGFRKKVEPVDGGFGLGSLVKITLTPDLSSLDADIGDTFLVIDDYIPTGMRFERYFFEDMSIGWHLLSRQGQRLQFCVYGAGKLQQLRPIVYYARCTTPGDYVVESAYINSSSGDTWGASDRATVRIG